MPADIADAAYRCASAVFGAGREVTTEVAVVALQRGGRSRSAVLGHVRAATLARVTEAATAELDAPPPADLGGLASALAATRPALERLIVALDTESGLDRGGFARAIGLPPTEASARAASVASDWQRVLDPVLLAHLGSGGCEGLAGVLATSGVDAGTEPGWDDERPSLRTLVEAGPGVADHVAGCDQCRDRTRAMVSVRSLLSQPTTEEAPAAVRAAASSSSRVRRPVPPPPLEPAGRRHRVTRAAIGAAAVVALVGAGVIIGANLRRSGDGRVEALTHVPRAGSALSVQPGRVAGATLAPVELRNVSRHRVEWSTEADQRWLSSSPSSGKLAAGATVALRIVLAREAPEGDVRGSLRVSGGDGSAAVIRVTTSVEHPPDVAATANGCDVAATVEDESDVQTVELHVLPVRHPAGAAGVTLAMSPAGDGFGGHLPNAAEATIWWVKAVDARGNAGRTAEATLGPNTCP